jgi:uncharacterized membrane protein
MTHQQAESVIAAPLAAVERQVRDVASWPGFLLGLEKVTEHSFERYQFVVKDGNGTREVDVAVVAHPGEHRLIWHALNGPRFEGEVRLRAVDIKHTRVVLSLTAEPKGFLAGLGDLVHSKGSAATLDLQRLDRLVTSPGH